MLFTLCLSLIHEHHILIAVIEFAICLASSQIKVLKTQDFHLHKSRMLQIVKVKSEPLIQRRIKPFQIEIYFRS